MRDRSPAARDPPLPREIRCRRPAPALGWPFMCGFVGILNFDGEKVDHDVLRRMTAALAHRGPDDEAVYLRANAGLGFRRLSIIDLSPAARQPMANEDRSVHLVFNGEIYNHADLRAELEAAGHRFRSKSDGEVILHGYEQWGEAVVGRLNGMFAFAVLDGKQDLVLVARDRFGIKPLYYHLSPERMIFASEIKGILASERVKAEADDKAIVEYLTFQNVVSERTFFRGVRLMSPGYLAVVRLKGPSTEFRRWWDADFSAELTPKELREEECALALRGILRDAIERQLMSDVPLGTYLSGGMDSGTLTAVASRAIPHLMTFTAGFDVRRATGLEAGFDERAAAEAMSSHFGTEQYEMVIQATDMPRVLPRLVWHMEVPRLGMSYPNFLISRLASRFVKVALSGAGGDELFGGYPWRYPGGSRARTIEGFVDAAFPAWQRVVPAERADEAYGPRLAEARRAAPPRERLVELLQNAPRFELWSPLNQALYFEMKTFLHGLLVLGDALSMAHSLEERVPFLDHALVDYALRVPAAYKYDAALETGAADAQGRRETSMGKRVLRRAMEGLVPEEILQRKKQGFSAPEKSWYRGPNEGYVRDLLLAPRTLDRGLLRPEFVRAVVGEHSSGEKNHRLLLWSLLCLEHWHRIFVDGEAPAEVAVAPAGRGRP